MEKREEEEEKKVDDEGDVNINKYYEAERAIAHGRVS